MTDCLLVPGKGHDVGNDSAFGELQAVDAAIQLEHLRRQVVEMSDLAVSLTQHGGQCVGCGKRAAETFLQYRTLIGCDHFGSLLLVEPECLPRHFRERGRYE